MPTLIVKSKVTISSFSKDCLLNCYSFPFSWDQFLLQCFKFTYSSSFSSPTWGPRLYFSGYQQTPKFISTGAVHCIFISVFSFFHFMHMLHWMILSACNKMLLLICKHLKIYTGGSLHEYYLSCNKLGITASSRLSYHVATVLIQLVNQVTTKL